MRPQGTGKRRRPARSLMARLGGLLMRGPRSRRPVPHEESALAAAGSVRKDHLELLRLEKDLFLAEYSSLRQEILQRISQQTLLTQIALTAFAAIAAFSLGKDGTGGQPMALLAYPAVAYFLAYSWAFNNLRVFQIAHYLQCREKAMQAKGLGVMHWETYINNDLQSHDYPPARMSRVRPGLLIFPGTQVASLVIWFLGYLNSPEQGAGALGNIALGLRLPVALIILMFIGLTIYHINKSNRGHPRNVEGRLLAALSSRSLHSSIPEAYREGDPRVR